MKAIARSDSIARGLPGFAVAALVTLALCAFAANSILCRLALGGGLVDPVSYTAVRIASGAAMLAIRTAV